MKLKFFLRIICILLISIGFYNVSNASYPVWVMPAQIKFNYEPGNTYDALTIQKRLYSGDYIPVPAPEWNIMNVYNNVPNEMFAYVKSQYNPKIQVQFYSNCDTMHLLINLTVTSGSGIGEIQSFFVPNYIAWEWIELELEGSTPPSIGVKEFTWEWKIFAIPVNSNNFCAAWETTTTTHEYYNLFDVPTAPMEEPWTSILDFAFTWAGDAGTKTEATTIITNELFACGFEYELSNGRSSFTPINDVSKYSVKSLLGALTTDPSDYEVNCVDLSRAIVCFSNAIGNNLIAKRINRIGRLIDWIAPIPVNSIDLIGDLNNLTNDPFETNFLDDDCRKGGFQMHSYAVDTATSKVWDATFRYDISGYPDDVKDSGPSYGNSCGYVWSVQSWVLPCNLSEHEYLDGILDDWIKYDGQYILELQHPSRYLDYVELSIDNFTIDL